jgi:phage shock protein PspC (stress-responsive transcriptional regulator)
LPSSEPTVPQRPRRLVRPARRRLIAGVCSGLGDHFGVDPILLRVAFVALAIFAGVGFWLYLAMFLLVPEEGAPRAPIGLGRASWRAILGIAIAVGALALALAHASDSTSGTHWGIAVGLSALALLGVLAAALWTRLRTRSHEDARPSADRTLLRRLAFATALVCAFMLIALAGAWVAGTDRSLAAWIVVGLGAIVLASAFTRHRWVLPAALAFALPVAIVAAARVDFSGGVGARDYRPLALVQLRHEYKLGAGRLEIDLRGISFPAGTSTLRARLGAGELVVLVPDSVCVATRARIGGGYVGALDRETQGLDVDWSSRVAPPQRARVLVVQARVGLGAMFIADRPFGNNGFRPGEYGTNSACRAVPAGAA